MSTMTVCKSICVALSGWKEFCKTLIFFCFMSIRWISISPCAWASVITGLCSPLILSADSKGPDQTARMRRLIWAFAVRICPKARLHIVLYMFETNKIIILAVLKFIKDTNRFDQYSNPACWYSTHFTFGSIVYNLAKVYIHQNFPKAVFDVIIFDQ